MAEIERLPATPLDHLGLDGPHEDLRRRVAEWEAHGEPCWVPRERSIRDR